MAGSRSLAWDSDFLVALEQSSGSQLPCSLAACLHRCWGPHWPVSVRDPYLYQEQRIWILKVLCCNGEHEVIHSVLRKFVKPCIKLLQCPTIKGSSFIPHPPLTQCHLNFGLFPLPVRNLCQLLRQDRMDRVCITKVPLQRFVESTKLELKTFVNLLSERTPCSVAWVE